TGGVPVNNPIGLETGQVMDLSALAALGVPLVVAVWLTALASLRLRYRRATGRERDQLKWFLYSASVVASLYAANIALRGGDALLTRFGAPLEDAIDPRDVGPRLAEMVRQGLSVEWVRVRIRPDSDGQIIVEPLGVAGIGSDALATPALSAPLVYGEERIGAIDCGPKRDGAFSTQDQELLTAIGLQAALSIRNAALTAELAERLAEIELQTHELTASRTRLVQAEEAGRRRIERDIHDGVQQQLVALLAKVRLARNQVGRGSEQAATTLAELQEDTRQALDDLREL